MSHNLDPVAVLERFLSEHVSGQAPLLLALSGGPDSLCLFYALLKCQKPFHVAHVDHSWRDESAEEARILEELALHHRIPFHKKCLNPHVFDRENLENACRMARYAFFRDLSETFGFYGVLTGHHADDQAETILKRVLEGSHWSHLGGLSPDTIVYGVRVLRPFLKIAKRDLVGWLTHQGNNFFEDPTNLDSRFLRGRMRQTLFPWLNQQFGKNVQRPLNSLGEEAEELRSYFDEKVDPVLSKAIRGPFGLFVDFQHGHRIEIDYALRKLATREGIELSREALQLGAQLLASGAANKAISAGEKVIRIDRHRLFIPAWQVPFSEGIAIAPGKYQIGPWSIEVSEGSFSVPVKTTSWNEGWSGEFSTLLPLGEYHLAQAVPNALCKEKNRSLAKWWNQNKIPAFLSKVVPVVWQGNHVSHEFLTGRNLVDITTKEPSLKITLRFLQREALSELASSMASPPNRVTP